MKIALVQLSDIHLKLGREANPVLELADAIVRAAVHASNECEQCFLVVSGDIAFSGRETEYDHGLTFLSHIRTELAKTLKLPDVPVAVVPGNHDCDFSQGSTVRDMVRTQVTPSGVDDSVITECTRVQNAYFDFLGMLDGHDKIIPKDPFERLYKPLRFEFSGYAVQFHLFNSAWMSQLHEDPGHLLFPVPLIHRSVSEAAQADLVVSVIHHPFNWEQPDNARQLRRCIEDNSDIVLTGHEHVAANYTKTTDHGITSNFLEGGALQDSDNPYASEFNVLVLDLRARQQTTYRFCLNRDVYENSNGGATRSFDRNRILTLGQFLFTPEFERDLDDPGAGYVHPHKANLRLTDLFVFPDFQEIKYEKSADEQRHMHGDAFIDYLMENHRVVVVGDERGGKTTLAKAIIPLLRNRSQFPLLIDAEMLVRCDDWHRLEKQLDATLELQYGEGVTERYWQLESSARTIVVDNFHRLAGNRRFRDTIAKLLSDHFGNVVLIGGEGLSVAEVFTASKEHLELWNFKHCRMLPFGHALRRDLISKWHHLGNEFSIEEDELDHRIDQADRQISTVCKIDLLPSIPLFVLILLQQLETSDRATTSSGSFGYLYEVLVTATLTRIQRSKFDLDWKYNYLTELAYELLSRERRAISVHEAENWNREYGRTYSLPLDFKELWGELVQAGILELRHGEYQFRYHYLLYFFIARYVRDHISEAEVQDLIHQFCGALHDEECANIIMFVCHLSKDESVVNAIINAANSMLKDSPEFDIENEGLSSKAARDEPLALPASDPRENLRKALEEEDQSNRQRPAKSNSANMWDGCAPREDASPTTAVFNAAQKTIELLGQVLRNFAGSMKAEPKFALVEQCFGLGLRLLNHIVAAMEGEQFRDIVRTYLAERPKPTEPAKLESAIDAIAYNVKQMFALSQIKHISSSVGSEKIAQTLSDVINESQNPSVHLIDLSIKLDHYRNFPEKDLDQLLKVHASNVFASSLIRYLVWHRLYLYPLAYDQKQRVCNKLDISVEGQARLLISPAKHGEGQGPRRKKSKRK